jgi:hypothetical protein
MEFKEIFPRKGFSLIEIINITSDIIERIINLNNLKQNKNSDLYNSLSFSWEMGFNEYKVQVGSRVTKEAEIIDSNDSRFEKYKLNKYTCHIYLYSMQTTLRSHSNKT